MARGVEILEVEAVVPGLFVVELLNRRGPHLELDRYDTRSGDEHGIDPAAEARDVELEVDPRGGNGFFQGHQGGAEHGQLEPPCRKLLGGERVAVRARERRIDLVVRGAEEGLDRGGVESSALSRARLGGHGG